MQQDRVEAPARVVGEVRRLFHRLRALADGLHGDLGLNAGQRGILESLATEGPASVPQLARSRPVSRQHIQSLVDPMLAAGLIEAVPNPAHKRSPLMSMTERGRTVFATVQERERAILDRLLDGVSSEEVEVTARVLGILNDRGMALVSTHMTKEHSDGDA